MTVKGTGLSMSVCLSSFWGNSCSGFLLETLLGLSGSLGSNELRLKVPLEELKDGLGVTCTDGGGGRAGIKKALGYLGGGDIIQKHSKLKSFCEVTLTSSWLIFDFFFDLDAFEQDMPEVDGEPPAPDREPPEVGHLHVRGQDQLNFAPTLEASEDRSRRVVDPEKPPGKRVRQDDCGLPGSGPFACDPGPEEGVGPGAVVAEVFDHEPPPSEGKHAPGHSVVTTDQ